MRPLLLTNTDRDGAGIAACRLNQALNSYGTDSHMLVQKKLGSNSKVLAPQSPVSKEIANLKPVLDALPLSIYKHREDTMFSIPLLPETTLGRIQEYAPDIINLHWICKGCLQIETLKKLQAPIVWTLHDMWAFTGGCHYSGDCQKYVFDCGACPQLRSQRSWDLSRWVWQRKASSWKTINLTLVSPSSWLAECAGSSALFRDLRIVVIPNGIDTYLYKPVDRNFVRSCLNLPHDKFLILFGSANVNDHRKGWSFLKKALQSLSQSKWHDRIELVVFGSNFSEENAISSFKTHYLGRLNDDISLSLIYGAANLFISPSLQDNLPNTVLEALSCGTPCVAFNIGGVPDLIEHFKNGYLAQPFEHEDLAKGVSWFIENENKYLENCKYARHKIENSFSLELQAKRYFDLFSQLIGS